MSFHFFPPHSRANKATHIDLSNIKKQLNVKFLINDSKYIFTFIKRSSILYKEVASVDFKMSSHNIPNELTTLKTSMQKDVEVNRAKNVERKSQWIQVES